MTFRRTGEILALREPQGPVGQGFWDINRFLCSAFPRHFDYRSMTCRRTGENFALRDPQGPVGKGFWDINRFLCSAFPRHFDFRSMTYHHTGEIWPFQSLRDRWGGIDFELDFPIKKCGLEAS